MQFLIPGKNCFYIVELSRGYVGTRSAWVRNLVRFPRCSDSRGLYGEHGQWSRLDNGEMVLTGTCMKVYIKVHRAKYSQDGEYICRLTQRGRIHDRKSCYVH